MERWSLGSDRKALLPMLPSSSGLGRWPFKPETSVRIRWAVLLDLGTLQATNKLVVDSDRANSELIALAERGGKPPTMLRNSVWPEWVALNHLDVGSNPSGATAQSQDEA